MQMCTPNHQNSWAPLVRTPSQWIGQPICWHPSLDPQSRPNSDHREGNNNSAGLGATVRKSEKVRTPLPEGTNH